MHILYVDDDLTITETVKLMLAEDFHTCDSTRFGEEAVALAEKGLYDIMILDILLPDIDGYEVLERLRAKKIELPYLIQSGLLDQDSEYSGLTLGVGEFLSKPFTKAQLIDKINQVVVRSDIQSIPKPEELVGRVRFRPNGEKRRHTRFRTVTPARILSGYGIDCTIINMSFDGATIRLNEPMDYYPQVFDLRLRSAASYRCEVRWKSDLLIGVKFLRVDF
ncbi:MAG: response regulator [Kiloniellales bacterium]|nr:response regulator [Kiloniellales bacterium]